MSSATRSLQPNPHSTKPKLPSAISSLKSKRPEEPEDLDYILARTLVVLGGSQPVGVWEEIVRDGIELFPRSILFNAPSRSTLMLSIREITTGGASLVRRHVAQHMAEWEAGELRAEQENLLRSIAWG